MPAHVRQLFTGSTYDPEVIAIMVQAYDLACGVLPETVSREIIARTILTVTGAGQRDVQRLAEFTILSLQDDERKQA